MRIRSAPRRMEMMLLIETDLTRASRIRAICFGVDAALPFESR